MTPSASLLLDLSQALPLQEDGGGGEEEAPDTVDITTSILTLNIIQHEINHVLGSKHQPTDGRQLPQAGHQQSEHSLRRLLHHALRKKTAFSIFLPPSSTQRPDEPEAGHVLLGHREDQHGVNNNVSN